MQSFLYDCELICKQLISLSEPCPLSLPILSALPLFSPLTGWGCCRAGFVRAPYSVHFVSLLRKSLFTKCILILFLSGECVLSNPGIYRIPDAIWSLQTQLRQLRKYASVLQNLWQFWIKQENCRMFSIFMSLWNVSLLIYTTHWTACLSAIFPVANRHFVCKIGWWNLTI